jgi:hypothetical protein
MRCHNQQVLHIAVFPHTDYDDEGLSIAVRAMLPHRAVLFLILLLTAVAGTALGVSPAAAVPPSRLSPAPVVVVGVGGLGWADVSPTTTPTLWRLLADSSAAALSVRTVELSTCPADGWLTLNAGVRATVPRTGPGQGAGCADITPLPRADGGADLPGWTQLDDYNAKFSYDPQLGLLTTAAARRGCATAVGPGAAIALGDQSGHVRRYARTLAQADVTACPLTVIDLGSLLVPPGPSRMALVRAVDTQLGRVVAAAPQAQLLVAGLSDSSPTPHLQLLMAGGPGDQAGWLTAPSTRHDGLVQLTDLTPTILADLGVETPPRAVGSVIHQAYGRPSNLARSVEQLRERDVAAETIDAAVTRFYWLVALGGVTACGLLALARRSASQRRPRPARIAALLVSVVGALPAASFLANLAPWWHFTDPSAALWSAVLASSLLLGVLAVTGPWRRQTFGPTGFLAAVTATTLAIDVTTGSRLQLSSLWGLSPLDAGRFYGLGNVAFAVFAVTVLVAATWAAAQLLARGRRRAATICVTAIGIVAIMVDGWPSFGADFGGVLALVPGFALLAAGIGRLRVTPRRVMAVAGTAVALVTTIAVLDWSRPAASRTHLGRFVQQVLDGGTGAVLRRKFDANLHASAQRPALSVLVLVVLLLAVVAVARPTWIHATWLVRAYTSEPVLRPCVAACLLTAVIGLAVNDSGINIPAVALATALPLVAGVWAVRSPARSPAGSS